MLLISATHYVLIFESASYLRIQFCQAYKFLQYYKDFFLFLFIMYNRVFSLKKHDIGKNIQKKQ